MRANLFSAKIEGDDAIWILEDGHPGKFHKSPQLVFSQKFFWGKFGAWEKLSQLVIFKVSNAG